MCAFRSTYARKGFLSPRARDVDSNVVASSIAPLDDDLAARRKEADRLRNNEPILTARDRRGIRIDDERTIGGA